MIPFEIDHIFILSTPGAPEADALVHFGWTEGSRNTHPGQGSANRRFFTRNTMLEFLWITDKNEATSGEAGKLGLFERSNWKQNGASPFGFCLRPTSLPTAQLPFPTWLYKVEYFPDLEGISMADEPAGLVAPEIFMLPFATRQEDYPEERKQPMEHAFGGEYLTETILYGNFPETLLALPTLQENGILSLVEQENTCLELVFDQANRGRKDFRPHIPLIIRY